jgi:hypothetical protein
MSARASGDTVSVATEPHTRTIAIAIARVVIALGRVGGVIGGGVPRRAPRVVSVDFVGFCNTSHAVVLKGTCDERE